MPRLPKWLGDAVEATFKSKIHATTVTATEYLHPRLKKIRFEGDFAGISFKIGYAVAFRVDSENFRNYTPSVFNPEKGICEVIFHLHGNGPGSQFAEKLTTGDRVNLIEPRGKSLLKTEAGCHSFFGDETTLGLYYSMKNGLNGDRQEATGIMEFTDLRSIPDTLKLPVKTIPRGNSYGESTTTYLREMDRSEWEKWRSGIFYLTGNAQSIQLIRKALREKGVPPKSIISQAFWAEGKKGL